MRFTMLNRPAEFKRVRGGGRHATPLFIVEGKSREADGSGRPADPAQPRFGLTITRKVGTAVVRNRIRRRLKEALRSLEAGHARNDYDYVVVASLPAHDLPFDELRVELARAFEVVHRGPARRRERKDGTQSATLASRTPAPLPPQRKSGKASPSCRQGLKSPPRPDAVPDAFPGPTPPMSGPKPTTC